MTQQSANAHQLNSYAHQHREKVAENDLALLSGDVVTINPNGFMTKALPGDFIEGVAVTSNNFASDNETGEKRKVNYRPIFWQNTYTLDAVPGQTFTQADVGQFFQLSVGADGRHYADQATVSPVSGQFRVESIIDALGLVVEVRFVPTTGYQPAIAGAPANVITYANPVCGTPVANVAEALDEIVNLLCPTATLAHVPAVIVNSPSVTSTASGTDNQTFQLEVDTTWLQTQVTMMETQTTLDQVDLNSAGNVLTTTVTYTGENGTPQAQADSANIINTGAFTTTTTGLKVEVNGVTIGEVPRSAISPNVTIDTNDTLSITPNGVGDLILTFTDDANAGSDTNTFNLTQYFGVTTSTDANGVITLTQNGTTLAEIHSHVNGVGTTSTTNANGTVSIDLAYDNDLAIVAGKLGVGGTQIRTTTTQLNGFQRIWEGSAGDVTIYGNGRGIQVSNTAGTQRINYEHNRIVFTDTTQADDPGSEIWHVNGDIRYKTNGGHFFFADSDADSPDDDRLAYSFVTEQGSFNPGQRYLMTMLQNGQLRIGYQGASSSVASPTGNGAIAYIRANNGLLDTVIDSTTANYSGLVLQRLTSASPGTAGAKALGVDADGLVVTIDGGGGGTMATQYVYTGSTLPAGVTAGDLAVSGDTNEITHYYDGTARVPLVVKATPESFRSFMFQQSTP